MIRSLRARARDFAYRHVGGTALVLIYHRVANLERDPQALAVSVANFEEQMTLLSENYHVVSLGDLAAGIRANRVPDRSVAVTFDDGYSDNLLNGAPALARCGVPATMFVCSGYANGTREFWWDEVERLVLAPGELPRRIELPANGSATFAFDLGDFATYRPEQSASDATWTTLAAPTNRRQRMYADLCAFLKPLSLHERSSVLQGLREAAGLAPAPREVNRQLTAQEVHKLDWAQEIRVGGHTRSHPVLSARTTAEQRFEILEDHDALSGMCGRPPESFSYPFGGFDDYTDETIAIVREAGYTHACANHPGVVKPWIDPYRIPRNLVRDWDAETFSAKLKGWFDDPR